MHISEKRHLDAMKLRADILQYLLANPGIPQTQVMDKFGLSGGTASRHVRAIRRGWRPAGWVDPMQDRVGA